MPINLEQKPLEEPDKTRIARHRKLAKYLLKTPETETEVIINDEENEQQEKKMKKMCKNNWKINKLIMI